MKPANYAPIYCALYPELAAIAQSRGYALAVHGSLARDFDLVCIPWQQYPSDPAFVVDEICRTFAIKEVGKPEFKYHGRKVYTLAISHGECFIDLSFMPHNT